MSVEKARENVVKNVLGHIEEYKVIGVGTGRTITKLINIIGRKDRFKNKLYVPSSYDTLLKLKSFNLKVLDLPSVDHIEVYVDSADEVDNNLNMIKGGGAALLREKILASIADHRVFIIDYTKLVKVLGSKSPVPLEVFPPALPVVKHSLSKLDLEWNVRIAKNGKAGPIVTDNGNFIIDVWFKNGVEEPIKTHEILKSIVGVIETGIFIGYVDILLVGYEDKVEVIDGR